MLSVIRVLLGDTYAPYRGVFTLVFYLIFSMSSVQLRAFLAARRLQRRAAIERDHAVTACATQVVIV